MRITDAQVRGQLLRRVTAAQTRIAEYEQRVASGRRVVDPSDDPTATALARRIESSLSVLESLKPSTDRARAHLDQADSILGSVTERMTRLQELTISMANGVPNDADRQAASDEAQQILESVVDLANTKIGDKYLFGGYTNDTAPFQPDGAYVGDPRIPEVEISPGVRIEASPDTAQAFTVAGGTDVMGVITAVRDALATGDVEQARLTLGQIDDAHEQVRLARSRLGPQVNRLDAAEQVRENLRVQLTEQLSDKIDADLPEAMSQLMLSSHSLEASLSMTAKALSQTLLSKL